MTELVTGRPGPIRCPEEGGDRVEFDSPPTVTVVRDSTGIEILTDETSTEVSGDDPYFKVTVPAVDHPDGLIATWSGEIEGLAAAVVTHHEVVGGHIVGVPAIRKQLEDAAQTPLSSDEEIAKKRDLAEHRIEDACQVAFRPRYAHETVEGHGHHSILLPRPRLLRVISLDGEDLEALPSIPGVITADYRWTGDYDIAWIHGHEVSPPSVAAAVQQLAVHYLLVDPDDLDARATFKSNDVASWSLVTPGVKGARFPIPEVNEVVKEFGYLGTAG